MGKEGRDMRIARGTNETTKRVIMCGVYGDRECVDGCVEIGTLDGAERWAGDSDKWYVYG